MSRLLNSFFSASTSWLVFVIFCFLYYGLLPLVLGVYLNDEYNFLFLSLITFLSCMAIMLGRAVPLIDYFVHGGMRRILIDSHIFHGTIWLSFLIYCTYAFSTAEAVPIISLLQGADEAMLNEQRGLFLKARTGYESALIYVSTMFVSVLLPFSLASLFLQKSKLRFLCFFIFLAYSVSFMQKALFLNVLLPLLYVLWYLKVLNFRKVMFFAAGSLLLLFYLVASNVSIVGQQGSLNFKEFFSAGYSAKGAIDYLVWRVVAVPLFSASDTLHVFFSAFSGDYLFGATSSFLSNFFWLERINLERIVFAYQWSWNDTANTNAFYAVDAYVNFSLIGVAIYSFAIGQIFRLFAISDVEALKSIWPIFCMAIFNGALIPTLLGNGFLLLFIMTIFIKERNS